MRGCPICGNELEILETEEGNKIYNCKAEQLQFCDHVLKATHKDMGNFACQDCYVDTIEECLCMDCFVFCGQCNGFIFCSCQNVIEIMDKNEETLANQRRLLEDSEK